MNTMGLISYPDLNRFGNVSYPPDRGSSGYQITMDHTQTISYPESSGFLVSGATPGRLWGHRILLPQDFCGKTMETVTEQPIKKIEFFRCPQSLPGVAPLTKKPEDTGHEIDTQTTERKTSRMREVFPFCLHRLMNNL